MIHGLALLRYNTEVQSRCFSWNHSYDDPWCWSGKLRQERPGQVILVWNIDWHWQTVSTQSRVDYHKEEAWARAWQQEQGTEDTKKKRYGKSPEWTRITDTKAWPRPPCWLQSRVREPDERRRANPAASRSHSFSLFFLSAHPPAVGPSVLSNWRLGSGPGRRVSLAGGVLLWEKLATLPGCSPPPAPELPAAPGRPANIQPQWATDCEPRYYLLKGLIE